MVAPVAPAELIHETAHKVLQNPDYDVHSLEGLRAAWEWLSNLLQPILHMFDALYGFSPVLFYAFMIVLFLALLALVAHIIYSFKTAMQRRGRAAHYQEADDAASMRPETWEARAQQALEAGDYLDAVRFILTSTLLRLEESRKGKLRRGATNREYLRRYRESPAYDPLSKIVEITDSRWFGGVDCTRADVEICFSAHEQVRENLKAGAPDV